MKKLIAILLVISMVSSFTISIGCFANEEARLNNAQTELSLNKNEENNVLGLLKNKVKYGYELTLNKTKYGASLAWNKTKDFKEITSKAIQGDPVSNSILLSILVAILIIGNKIYKVCKNARIVANAANTEEVKINGEVKSEDNNLVHPEEEQQTVEDNNLGHLEEEQQTVEVNNLGHLEEEQQTVEGK